MTLPTVDLTALAPLTTTGVILTREALAAGLSEEDLRRLVTSRTWHRVRRGAYAQTIDWQRWTPEQRHLAAARAVLRAVDQPAVLSHVSAAVALGLPVWGADLREVHLVRPATRQGARREGGVVHHAASLPDEHWTTAAGLPVTTPTRTVLDVARAVGFESAVVTADAALHTGVTTRQSLLDLHAAMLDWPGSRAAGRAIAFADGRAESPGESRGRVFCHVHGLPEPLLQVDILDEAGRFVGRVDFLFERQRTIAEFDGRVKYRAGDGGNPEDIVWREKQREDALRALGYEVVRFTWSDLDRRGTLVLRRIRTAFERAARRAA
jgi:hypothetical protein